MTQNEMLEVINTRISSLEFAIANTENKEERYIKEIRLREAIAIKSLLNK